MSPHAIPQFDVSPPEEFGVPGTDLRCRRFTEQDAEKLLNLAQDPALQQFVPWAKQVHDLGSARDVLASFADAWNRRVMARYAIEAGGQFVGYCGLWRDQASDYFEFGFAMLPAFRGQGIGTKIVGQLIDLVKERLRAKGVVAYVNDANGASRAVVTKLGFQATDEFDDGDRRYELELS